MLEPEKSRTETVARSTRRERTRIQFRRTERLPSRRTSVVIATSAAAVPERSRTTALVFQAILGVAACLALVGVVASTQDPARSTQIQPGSPDDPPPAVFVQFD